jgi:Glycosyltransferases involved in cell wall biogenesis
MKVISIVVPVYNEQDNLKVFYQEVCKYMEKLPYQFELLFIDDGSSDDTVMLLDRIIKQDARVRGLVLARNFGHQIALTCGLDYAKGDAVITMDGDMQHPPELLPKLINRWEEGSDVVQTVRINTEGVSWLKKVTSGMFYKVINAMSNVRVVEGGSDFRLMDKKVVACFRQFKDKARFIRGIIGGIGYRQTYIEFIAPKRFAGVSKFSLKKMLLFAVDGITSYSKLPLRLAFYLGMVFGLFSFAILLHVLYIKLFTADAIPGWATTSASISMFGGLQLIGLGIIGEYVGRIFEEVKERPLYWLKEELESSNKLLHQ